MGVTSNLEPKKVFHYFEEISKIPHGSYNTKQISDYLANFAKERGLDYVQDELNNVLIYGPASPGYEDAEPVLLQGHMDMVCEKVPGCPIDMANEGIKLIVDGDWLKADGTTLGADDGMAVAMMLALLDPEEDYEHPALECIFTVDEETGLEGAEGFDATLLHGNRMINLDSEDEGIITVSCAGGITGNGRLPVSREAYDGKVWNLKLTGLIGGHSGIEINKERANANILIARVFSELGDKVDYRLVCMKGGSADNVICKETLAQFVSPANDAEVADAIKAIQAVINDEYVLSDPDIRLELTAADQPMFVPMDAASTGRVISYLLNAPSGIINMSMGIKDLVETSLNLGALKIDENEMTTLYCLRSSVKSRLDFVCRRLEDISRVLGGEIKFSLYYPGWEYRAESPLRDICVEVFKAQYGYEPKIEAIHAGLECGFFAGKMGRDFDAVSIGPDLLNVHTPDEKASIPSTERTWKYLLGILKVLK
ncbi:MAG: aminoacyl-histidine dipeptidase [Firmicutes bacterium]|nr:aminoacyl-histidine dipeptidase [Bacillota bacterium]